MAKKSPTKHGELLDDERLCALTGLDRAELGFLRGEVGEDDRAARRHAALWTFGGFVALMGAAAIVWSVNSRWPLAIGSGLAAFTWWFWFITAPVSMRYGTALLAALSLCIGSFLAWSELGAVRAGLLVSASAFVSVLISWGVQRLLRRRRIEGYGATLPKLLPQIAHYNRVVETLRVADELAAVNEIAVVESESRDEVAAGLRHVRVQFEKALKTDKILRENKHVAAEDLEHVRISLIESTEVHVPQTVMDSSSALQEAAAGIAEMQAALRELG